jgi:photosystem II stability/assembly factor-like uncharacterized protein
MSHHQRSSEVFCIVLFAWCFAGVVHAHDRGWRAIGPERGTAYTLAIDPRDPDIVYAGTKSGVFKSTDGGIEWLPTNTGLPTPVAFPENGGPYVFALTIDPHDRDTLYAGVTFLNFFGEPSGRGVFVSRNGGATWEAANAGIESRSILALAVDPRTPSTLYALGRIFIGTPQVLKSLDGGASWSVLANLTAFPLSLAIDPRASGTVYVGTTSGIVKTSDGGGTWMAINAGLTNLVIDALTIDTSSSATVYAGTRGGGVFRSTDGGASWSPVNTGLTALEVSTLETGRLKVVYAGTRTGQVFRSINGGTTWRAVNDGLTAPLIHRLAVDPHSPGTIYAGTDRNGVFKSTDAGGRWRLSDLRNVRVFSLAVDPSAGGSVLIGDDWGRVYRQQDESDWTFSPDLDTADPVQDLAVDPLTPANVFAATRGIFKSVNGGVGFDLSVLIAGLSVAIDPAVPSTVYAAGSGVFKSTNGGATWTQLAGGLPSGRINKVVVDPQTPTTVYAATRGVYKSEDGGATWASISEGLGSEEIATLAVDPQNPSTIYASVRNALTPGLVYKSVNGGATWSLASTGLPPFDVYALVINPTTPAHVFAGTFGGGVFTSIDGGANWTAMNRRLPNLFVRALAIHPEASRLYAGTDGAGVFTASSVTRFALTVDTTGRGRALVVSSAGGITCGFDCSEQYEAGTTVFLTATAESGFVRGWKGCDSDTGIGRTSTCTVTLDEARHVEVNVVAGR